MTTARARLTKERVLAAAVVLADREGAEALTVRRLAEDLGVHPTSLYNHVPSKAAILDGVVERLFEQGQLPAEVGSWQDWVRAMAVFLRETARAHPGAFLVLTRRPADNAAAYRQTELGLSAFLAAGFSLPDAVHCVRAVSLALLGLAINECPPTLDYVEPTAADYDAAGFSGLAAAAEAVYHAGAARDGDWHALVEALVAGLDRRRTA